MLIQSVFISDLDCIYTIVYSTNGKGALYCYIKLSINGFTQGSSQESQYKLFYHVLLAVLICQMYNLGNLYSPT